jgi:hypothetical protein
MKIRPVGDELFHADRQVTRIRVAFLQFCNLAYKDSFLIYIRKNFFYGLIRYIFLEFCSTTLGTTCIQSDGQADEYTLEYWKGTSIFISSFVHESFWKNLTKI